MPATSKRPDDIVRGAAFAKLLTAARQELGWSQDKVAAMSGVNRTTVIRWERGDAARPDPTALKDVCRTLGVRQQDALRALGYLDAAIELQAAA